MTTNREISVEAVRSLGLQAGDSLHVLEEREGIFLMQIVHASPIAVTKRGRAGDWAREARGAALLEADQSRDEGRMAYYREKFGVS